MTSGKASVGVVTSGGGTYNIDFNDGYEIQFEDKNLKDMKE